MVICGSLSSLLLAAWNLFPVRQTCGLIEACSDLSSLQLKCESFLFQCDFNNNVLPERRMPFRKGKSGGKRDGTGRPNVKGVGYNGKSLEEEEKQELNLFF